MEICRYERWIRNFEENYQNIQIFLPKDQTQIRYNSSDPAPTWPKKSAGSGSTTLREFPQKVPAGVLLKQNSAKSCATITLKQRCGSALISMRIRIQGAKLMQIRILVRLCRQKKLNFYLKIIEIHPIPTWVQCLFERLDFRFIC